MSGGGFSITPPSAIPVRWQPFLGQNLTNKSIRNMGWKASTIIINKPTPVHNENLLEELGFTKLTKIDDEPFEVAINPDEKKVYIGTYK